MNDQPSDRLVCRAFEASTASIVVTAGRDADHAVVDVNPAFEMLTGYARDEVRGRNLRFLFAHDRDQEGLQLIRDALAQHRPVTAVLRNYRKDGALFWNEVRMAPLRSSDRDVSHWVAVQDDVTDRVRKEHQLQEAEQRFRLVADAAPVMIWVADADKRCTYVNNAWLEFTARSLEQVLGDGWGECLHPDDRSSCFAVYSGAFDNRRSYRMEYRLRRRDGAWRWILETGVPRYSETGALAGYIGSCLDITERIEAERALRASEARFRSIAEHTYDWESWIGPHMTPLWINPAVERITGYSVAECMGMRHYPLPLVYRADRERFVQELKAPQGNDLPFRIVCKDKTVRHAAISWQAITDQDGHAAGYRTSVRETSRQDGPAGLSDPE